jgi:hypothetical protein
MLGGTMYIRLNDEERNHLGEILKDFKTDLTLFQEGTKILNKERSIQHMMTTCKQEGFISCLEYILNGKDFTPYIGGKDERDSAHTRCRENAEETHGE